MHSWIFSDITVSLYLIDYLQCLFDNWAIPNLYMLMKVQIASCCKICSLRCEVNYKPCSCVLGQVIATILLVD